MGKISPVSVKYIIHADLQLTGVAEKPDIIGAVFGQTEGLLGTELELRELQKSGRIGRIDVKTEVKGGKTTGEILLPSSMGKSETAIIAAALETIERVGPCDAKIKVSKIEDVRISKRNFILDRAKLLLKDLVEDMPDSSVFTNQVTESVRALEITEYGKDRLPAGPNINDFDEIIIVEGRADVLNLLKHGIRNVIALKGSKASASILTLAKKKVTTLFVDGDRGGDLIIKKLADLGDLDFVAKAPSGKEVEELVLKEIHKALRAKITWQQALSELSKSAPSERKRAPAREKETAEKKPTKYQERASKEPAKELGRKEAKLMKSMFEELVGSRGAFVLGEHLDVLGKVPVKELTETLKDISEGVFAIVMDGAVDAKLVKVAESMNISFVFAKSSSSKSKKVQIVIPEI